MSIYDYRILRKLRPLIQDTNKNFTLTYNNKTVTEDLPISFTMKGDDYLQCRRNINKITTREYLPPSPGSLPSQRRPLNERWSARFFDLPTVFQKLNLKKSNRHELDWFYDIREWDQYRSYMASDNRVSVPYYEIYKPRTYNLAPKKEIST